MATNAKAKLNNTQIGVREALLEKAANGNTSYIRKKDILNHNGFETSWDWYDRTMCKFESEARKYVKRLFDILAIDGGTVEDAIKRRDDELDAICSDLIELKKEMLEVIDPDHRHHCSSHDGDVIGMFAHGTQATANNVSGDKGFESTVQDTFASRAKFRHALEGYFGRIILNAGMMTPERATFLREERKLIGAVRSGKKNIEEIESEISGIKSAKAKAPGGAVYFDEVLKGLRARLEGAKNSLKTAESNLQEFYKANPEGLAYEPSIQEVMEGEKKDEMKQAVAERVQSMTKKEKTELLKKHDVKVGKKAVIEQIDKKVFNLLMALAEQQESEPQTQAEPEQAEPQAAEAKAK